MIEERKEQKLTGKKEEQLTPLRNWLRTALFLFLIASLFGTLMRVMFVVEIPFLKYKHLLHAHSHTAMLGWGFMLLTAGMIFCSSGASAIKKYRPIYLLSTIAAAGMAISFTWQGYGPVSIFFSSLHILTMYIFAFRFLRSLKTEKASASKVFFRWSVIWMVISSLGILSLGITSAMLGKHHPLFYAGVQFFLHFQFNGWFAYGALGLLIRHLERSGKEPKIHRYAFPLMQLSLLLTYTLSITWSTPLDILFHMNTLGVILQLAAYGLILKKLFPPLLSGNSTWKRWPELLMLTGLSALLFKVVIQALVVWPSIAVISYTIRNYVIAFIHLIMLGALTCSVCGVLLKENVLPRNQYSKAGWRFLLAGFLSTEILLFGQGTLLWMKQGFLPGYDVILLTCTSLLPVGIALLFFGAVKANSPEEHAMLEF